MKRPVFLAIFMILMCSSTGCTMMSDVGDNMTRTMRMFRPRPFDDNEDPAAEDAYDEWGEMMREGRPNGQTETETDDWWWNNVMSQQSRSIERSLGVGP